MAVFATSAVARTPNPSPQGEARLEVDARMLPGNRVRVKVKCDGAIAWTGCRGRVRLTSRGAVATRRGGPRQLVLIARGDVSGLRPGSSTELVMSVMTRARYHLRRQRLTRASGRVENLSYAGGRAATIHTNVRITRGQP